MLKTLSPTAVNLLVIAGLALVAFIDYITGIDETTSNGSFRSHDEWYSNDRDTRMHCDASVYNESSGLHQ